MDLHSFVGEEAFEVLPSGPSGRLVFFPFVFLSYISLNLFSYLFCYNIQLVYSYEEMKF